MGLRRAIAAIVVLLCPLFPVDAQDEFRRGDANGDGIVLPLEEELSTVRGLDIPGVRKHALATRPIGRFVQSIDGEIERLGQLDRPARVAIHHADGWTSTLEAAGGVRVIEADASYRLENAGDAAVEIVLVEVR